MSIQIRQIKGDIVELLFNPREEDLRVGENLTLRENGSDRGLIVQIIEFRTVTYPSLLLEMMEMVAEDARPTPAEAAALEAESISDKSNLKLAIAKIRKVVRWATEMAELQV